MAIGVSSQTGGMTIVDFSKVHAAALGGERRETTQGGVRTNSGGRPELPAVCIVLPMNVRPRGFEGTAGCVAAVRLQGTSWRVPVEAMIDATAIGFQRCALVIVQVSKGTHGRGALRSINDRMT